MNTLNESYKPTQEIQETHRKLLMALSMSKVSIVNAISGEVSDIQDKINWKNDSVTFYGFIDVKTENATYSISYEIFELKDADGKIITRRSPTRAIFPTLSIFAVSGSNADINERAKVIKMIADICQKECLKVGLNLLHSYEHTSKDFAKYLIRDTKNKYLNTSDANKEIRL